MSETIKHAGLIIKLEHDGDCESPLDFDCQPRFAMWHRQRSNPAPEYTCPDDVFEAVRAGAKAFPVRAYEHSLISFTVLKGYQYPYTDVFDSGFAGFVVFTPELIKEAGFTAPLEEVAESVLEEYAKWCNGECYYYTVKNAVGEQLDSCGGYIGYDYALEQAKEAAEACAEQEAERLKTFTAVQLDDEGEEEEHTVEAVSMADALRQLTFDPIRLTREEVA